MGSQNIDWLHLHTPLDPIFTTSSPHHLFAPRTNWCVEPVSNEPFYYLNPRLHPPFLPGSLPPPPPPPLHVYTHLHCTWQRPVVFGGEEENTTALVKISRRQNSLSLPLSGVPGRGGGMEGAKALLFLQTERLSENKANHMRTNAAANHREGTLGMARQILLLTSAQTNC